MVVDMVTLFHLKKRGLNTFDPRVFLNSFVWFSQDYAFYKKEMFLHVFFRSFLRGLQKRPPPAFSAFFL